MKRPSVFVLAAAFVATAAYAQSDSSGTKPAAPSYYTLEQADRGKAAHAMNCTSCHGTEAYTGESFTKTWVGRTAFDFYDQLRTTMPNDNPGALKPEEYIDILAYIFSINGLPAGTEELRANDDALKALTIDSLPPKAGPEQVQALSR